MPQIGYVGQLYPGKGLEVVLETAWRLPEFDFHVIGGTERDVSKWRNRPRPANFHLHGFVPHSEVGGRLMRMDMLLLPNLRKVAAWGGGGDIGRWTSPLKLFEYMSAGKPIVASDLPVLREVLSHGENCLLSDPDKIEEWVANIRLLQSQPAMALRLGAKAKKEFFEKYQWKQRAFNVLDGLTQGRVQPHP